jgi:hypothetical protein
MNRNADIGRAGSATNAIGELEEDIEATRRRLDATLEALQERLSPGRRMRAAMTSARTRAVLGGRRTIALARRYPAPFAILGVSIVLYMTSKTWRGR